MYKMVCFFAPAAAAHKYSYLRAQQLNISSRQRYRSLFCIQELHQLPWSKQQSINASHMIFFRPPRSPAFYFLLTFGERWGAELQHNGTGGKECGTRAEIMNYRNCLGLGCNCVSLWRNENYFATALFHGITVTFYQWCKERGLFGWKDVLKA